jgi:RNA polymerase sigma-70 factor (ECF subfamily)
MNHWFKLVKTQPECWEHAAYLRRLQAGDEAAWEQFLAEWSPRLYSYVRYTLRGADETEDVLSDTLLTLVQAIGSFDGKVTLSTFIYSIACHKIADCWRGRHVTSELPVWLSTADPSDPRIALYEVLTTLPEQAQQAVLLRYHVGLRVAEIAEVLGCSYKATESLLSRVRHQLQTAFLGRAET